MNAAHVVGAGLAGLNAALRLALAGNAVTLYDAAPHAGGRCRSFFDASLDAVIDNGRHLMVSGNSDTLAYLDLIGARDLVEASPRARFDFYDVDNGARWAVDFGRGRGRLSVLHALMRARNRPPGVTVQALIADLRKLRRAGDATVAECLQASPAYAGLWRPLAVAVLNTPPATASAEQLHRVLAETVLKGGAYARPLLTRAGLGAVLIDPALAALERLGATVKFSTRIKGLVVDGGRVAELTLADGSVVLGGGDRIVLAVPHFQAAELLDGIDTPAENHAILNAHYALPDGWDAAPAMTGVLNGQAEWVFVSGRIASVTISAADAWMDKDADAIARTLWPEVRTVLGLDPRVTTVPPCRVIKERRATFAQTVAAQNRRPHTRTALNNLVLAGDWTDTGLPATIEGALRSGRVAAEALF